MSNLELKVNALFHLVMAEDSASYAEAKAKILDLMKQEEPERKPNPETEPEIRAMLTKLGMPEHIKGHRYTVAAIRFCVEKPDIIDAITKELYPAVATEFETTPSRVERAIRHAIEVVWERQDPKEQIYSSRTRRGNQPKIGRI